MHIMFDAVCRRIRHHELYATKVYHFYRAMHFSAKRGIAIACRLSVCLSVRPSVCPSVRL